MSLDQRRHPRKPVTLLVAHSDSPSTSGRVDYATDLSRSGLFIRTREVLAEGSPVQVSFSPKKNAQLVQAFCRVVRTTPEGMAAEFIQMDPTSAALLEQVTSSPSAAKA